MIVLAAWCAGMAVWVIGEDDRSKIPWEPLVGILPALIFRVQSQGGFIVVGIFSLWLAFQAHRPHSPKALWPLRQALFRFWQQVAVLLSAGLTFWHAVEVSARSEPSIASRIEAMAERVQQQPQLLPDATGLPVPEGQATALLLQHGYLHGIAVEQVEEEARSMKARLEFEEESRRRRDPLWMTVLPALLLLNVLWIFVAPMGAMASHSWIKI